MNSNNEPIEFRIAGTFASGVSVNQVNGFTYKKSGSEQLWTFYASSVTNSSGGIITGYEMQARFDPTDNHQLDVELFKFTKINDTKSYRKKIDLKNYHHPQPYFDGDSTVYPIEAPPIFLSGTLIVSTAQLPAKQTFF